MVLLHANPIFAISSIQQLDNSTDFYSYTKQLRSQVSIKNMSDKISLFSEYYPTHM